MNIDGWVAGADPHRKGAKEVENVKKQTCDLAQKLRNTGAQEVPALRKTGGACKAKAVRGKDLRSGK